MNFLTKETILDLIEKGKKDHLNKIDLTDAIILIEDTYGDFWSKYAYMAGRWIARGRWAKDLSLEEKTWERFGLPRINYNYNTYVVSHNYRDDQAEPGISVMNDNWKNTYGYFESLAKGEKIYTIKGIQIGWGSDDEPVIIPTGLAKEMK